MLKRVHKGHNFSLVLAGQYNEMAFKALDKIVDDASKSGVKLILPLSDNWHLQDGLYQYVEWGGSMGTGDFFTDPKIIRLFKDHISAIVNRTNTLNGRQYKDEPAIFAWDLINELRDGCNQSAPNATCDPTFTGSVQVQPLHSAPHNAKIPKLETLNIIINLYVMSVHCGRPCTGTFAATHYGNGQAVALTLLCLQL